MLLLATPLILASSAYADLISIGLQEVGTNGGMITTLATGSGAVSLGPTSYGSFNVNQVSAQDFVDLGPPTLLDSNTLDISTSKAGVLNVWVTAQGLSGTLPTNFLSDFAVNALHGSIVQVTLTTYFSPTNVRYTGTVLTPRSFAGIGSAGPLPSSGTPSGLYSVTEEYQIFDVGGAPGNDNLTMDLSGTTVPEPASLGLLGAGLLGIAWKLRR